MFGLIKEYQKQPQLLKLNQQKSEPNCILIIDTLGKLQLAKWRLMSDRVPLKYLTQVPTGNDLKLLSAGAVILQLCDFYKMIDFLRDEKEFFQQVSVIVVGKKDEEKGLRHAFSQGAKAILTFPLDLPKLSAVCRRELEKSIKRSDVHKIENQFEVTADDKRPALIVRKSEKTPAPEKPNLRNMVIADRAILNTLNLGVLYVGIDSRIIFANRSFKKIMSSAGEIVRGRKFLELFPNRAGQLEVHVNNLIEESLKKNKTYRDVEVMLPGDEEEPIPGLVNIKHVFSAKGDRTGSLLTLNVSRVIKEKEDMRARSEKLAVAGQLAAGAVHEIKNPLTSVRGFIQLLQKELEGNPKAEYIDIIIGEIDRVNNIVNEFLKLAKPAVPKRTSCSLAELFEEIRIIMESEAFLKNVVIEERYSQLPPIKIDKEQIKQVLINIIQNSFDAMPEGGRLTIHAEPVEMEKKIKIDFIDTGIGMPEEVFNKMFEPFYTTKEHGTGLGLSVSQQILESHGGSIVISSKPGEGTVTTLYLPY